jgi:excisionase family DNA binding protein
VIQDITVQLPPGLDADAPLRSFFTRDLSRTPLDGLPRTHASACDRAIPSSCLAQARTGSAGILNDEHSLRPRESVAPEVFCVRSITPDASRPEPLLSLTAAARLLGISDPTMRRIVRTGRLTAVQDPVDGRRKLVHRGEVERLRAATTGLASGKEEADAW